jgi:hypothetical protein
VIPQTPAVRILDAVNVVRALAGDRPLDSTDLRDLAAAVERIRSLVVVLAALHEGDVRAAGQGVRRACGALGADSSDFVPGVWAEYVGGGE